MYKNLKRKIICTKNWIIYSAFHHFLWVFYRSICFIFSYKMNYTDSMDEYKSNGPKQTQNHIVKNIITNLIF